MTAEMHSAPTGGRDACVNFAGFARKRIAAARRMEPLPCGCRDPWLCHCHRNHHISTEARLAADMHLAAAGLAPKKEAA